MFKQAIAVIGLLSIVAISISEAAVEIGAFNAYVYGKSKASKPDVVAIFIEVYIASYIYVYVYYIASYLAT